MPDWLSFLVTILAGLAAVFGYLVLQRVGERGLNRDEATLLLREEAERIRRTAEDQARSLRQEVGDIVRGAQDQTLTIVRELSQVAVNQGRQSGDHLIDSIKSIEARIDGGLSQRLLDALNKNAAEQRALHAGQIDQLSSKLAESQTLIEAGSTAVKEAVQAAMSHAEAGDVRRQQALIEAISNKLGELIESNNKAAALRDDVTGNVQRLGMVLDETLKQLGTRQTDRLEQISQALRRLAETHEKEQLALRQAVDGALDAIRQENASKIDDLKRLKELETQNAQLRRAIADLMLEKTALTEALKDRSPAT
jgi:hypothetical protein